MFDWSAVHLREDWFLLLERSFGAIARVAPARLVSMLLPHPLGHADSRPTNVTTGCLHRFLADRRTGYLGEGTMAK
jgi:hypothetical protein